jgi:hypothetical protein
MSTTDYRQSSKILTWQSGHRGDSQGVFLVAQIFPYGHYGMFASLPLRPNSYGRRHAKLANFLEGLAFRCVKFLDRGGNSDLSQDE